MYPGVARAEDWIGGILRWSNNSANAVMTVSGMQSYEHFGLWPLPSDPRHLFVLLKDLQELLQGFEGPKHRELLVNRH